MCERRAGSTRSLIPCRVFGLERRCVRARPTRAHAHAAMAIASMRFIGAAGMAVRPMALALLTRMSMPPKRAPASCTVAAALAPPRILDHGERRGRCRAPLQVTEANLTCMAIEGEAKASRGSCQRSEGATRCAWAVAVRQQRPPDSQPVAARGPAAAQSPDLAGQSCQTAPGSAFAGRGSKERNGVPRLTQPSSVSPGSQNAACTSACRTLLPDSIFPA
jgi:hypothetical protein